jgi:hypothetical protein
LTGITYKSFRKNFYCILLGILTLSCSSSDEDTSGGIGNTGFFTSIYRNTPIEATLIFDLDSLIQYKESGKEVQGTLSLNLEEQLTIPVELRARGVFRKKHCPFPPIRLQLKKAATLKNDWGDYRNYKLVTHCFDTTTTDELLLREFLIYKMYEQLSDMSFKTQLLRMQYLIEGDTLRHFAILIENELEMSERLGLQEMDIRKTRLKSIHFDHYKKFVLFQYMVGNTDWNLKEGHNTKYVLEDDSDTPIIIPYDFDCSGLVNAPYAMPYSTLPIEDVRQRYFMYQGKKTDDFDSTISGFIEQKESFYFLVNSFPYLSDYAKNDVLTYIGEFYEIIEDPDWKDQLFASEE